jgi:hypothetical protein
MKVAVPAAVVVIVAALFLLPIDVSRSIDAVGVTATSREWQVVRESAGRIVVSMYNNENGGTESFLVHQFQREDAVQVDLLPGPMLRGFVDAGDTLAVIRSANLSMQASALEGSIAEARAALDVSMSGEKKEVVEQARTELDQARAEYEGREKARTRLKQLLERGVATQQEVDDATRLADASHEALASAEARVRVATTGEKESRVAYSRAQVASLEQQRTALERKQTFFFLRAPFAGRAVRTAFSDTLIRIGDTSRHVVAMLVPWSADRQFDIGSAVSVSIPGVAGSISGHIVQKNSSVTLQRGAPVMIAVAALDRYPADSPLGLPASCTITCGSMSLSAYLRATVLRILRIP